MWKLGAARAELLQMLSDRLRTVFAPAELWATTEPDTLQIMKVGAQQVLANHWDRRDKWLEGIASVAWGELPAEGANRGEGYTLAMQRGPKREIEEVKVEMVAGAAYVLMGHAQGHTRVCQKHCSGHNRCNCCWTHGVRMAPTSTVTRHSMTLRVLADGDSDDEDGESDDEEEASLAADAPQSGATTSAVAPEAI